MPFSPARWPNAVTIAGLIAESMHLEAHCHRCGRFGLLDPASLGLALETPVPALEGRFRCERCGSRETSARPHFAPTGLPGRSDASAPLSATREAR